ncbi:MAG: Mur ligase family protein, partial [Flavobacteriales bacterium]|nr:Mur ligase family protein [Flavobacteriales bacterium]
SKGRLKKVGLLPSEMGWSADRITNEINAVILGMHAREDNTELVRAKELGLKIYSYPEYLYEQTKDKTRVVIGGSHGKTTITAMILHVLNKCDVDCDYMVGAQLDGFDVMVRLSDAPIVILEGDEYLSSPIDRRPKFHLYRPHVALISGIAWDHVNVFPTFENYVEQFSLFADLIEKKGKLIYCEEDLEVRKVAEQCENEISKVPYSIPRHITENGKTFLLTNEGRVPLKVFGNHNLMNLNGARLVCNSIGVDDESFYSAIQDFKGASKRLELIAENETVSVYKDFAHSPSKLKATTTAVKNQFDNRELIACMELHTFSSLKKEFLSEYIGSMDNADVAIVYFSPHTLEHKKLPPLTADDVRTAFAREDILVITESGELLEFLRSQTWKNKNLLMMSSGNFGGIDVQNLGAQIKEA